MGSFEEKIKLKNYIGINRLLYHSLEREINEYKHSNTVRGSLPLKSRLRNNKSISR
jgi:hypothetical protein